MFASMQDLLMTEEDDSERMLHNIHDLATQLYQNVCVSLSVNFVSTYLYVCVSSVITLPWFCISSFWLVDEQCCRGFY